MPTDYLGTETLIILDTEDNRDIILESSSPPSTGIAEQKTQLGYSAGGVQVGGRA